MLLINAVYNSTVVSIHPVVFCNIFIHYAVVVSEKHIKKILIQDIYIEYAQEVL